MNRREKALTFLKGLVDERTALKLTDGLFANVYNSDGLTKIALKYKDGMLVVAVNGTNVTQLVLIDGTRRLTATVCGSAELCLSTSGEPELLRIPFAGPVPANEFLREAAKYRSAGEAALRFILNGFLTVVYQLYETLKKLEDNMVFEMSSEDIMKNLQLVRKAVSSEEPRRFMEVLYTAKKLYKLLSGVGLAPR